MKKILIINVPGLSNKGGMAVIMGALKNLREHFPQAEIAIVCHHISEIDALKELCQKYQVKIYPHPWLKEHKSKITTVLHSAGPALATYAKFVFFRFLGIFDFRPNNFFHNSDIILDLNIDTLHDHYGPFFPLWTLSNILLGKLSGKPVIVWSSGIGHFKKTITRYFAKTVLNKVDMILVREEGSQKYLKQMGVIKPGIMVTADHAFYLDPASPKRVAFIMEKEGIVKNQHPLVGIAASQLIHRYAFPGIPSLEEKYNHNVNVMSKIADYIVEKLDASVVLIPHVIIPSEDDRIFYKNMIPLLKNKDRVKLISGDYLADEYKGIIGECDLFIGARMHTTIASTSMAVPTIAIVYGQKSYGIIGEMLGQRKYMVEIEKHEPDEFLKKLQIKVDNAWANRNYIRNVLKLKSETVKNRVLLNSDVLRDILVK